ncbi:MAG: efflux RND transporter periplasmic adaptor subunit [Planctomycetes bacterium]|nr:efflux RND transporter periplasmic adaptor subunit [Planctomycetota bacterium]
MRAILALFVLLVACGGQPEAARGTVAPKAVTLVTVGTVPMPRAIEVTGTLAAHEQLELGLQVGGRLARLPVDVGDRVTGGQEIAGLDEQDFRLQHDRASAALGAAMARLGLLPDDGIAGLDLEATAPVREATAVLGEAKLSRERTADLVQQNLRARAELEVAEAAVAIAESRLQGARDDVRTWIAETRQRQVEFAQAEKQLRDCRLLAPWDGRVARRHVSAGQFVGTGDPVVTLLRLHPLRLRLQVPERLLGGVAIGQAVEFVVDGTLEPAAKRGIVVRLGAEIERSSRTLLVEAEVANPEGELLAGGFCRARIITEPAAPVVAVPRSAVLSFAGVDRVFTVQGGKAQAVIVKLARAAGDLIEVTSGVAAGAQIVAAPQGLVHNAAVTVAN